MPDIGGGGWLLWWPCLVMATAQWDPPLTLCVLQSAVPTERRVALAFAFPHSRADSGNS